MTDKEFQALLNGKKIEWSSGEETKRYIEEAKKKKKLDPDEIIKKKIKKQKKENG